MLFCFSSLSTKRCFFTQVYFSHKRRTMVSCMKVLGLFNLTAHPWNLPSLDCSLFILLLLTSSLRAPIITTATRGHCRNRHWNMGHDELLSLSTCLVVFLTRTRSVTWKRHSHILRSFREGFQVIVDPGCMVFLTFSHKNMSEVGQWGVHPIPKTLDGVEVRTLGCGRKNKIRNCIFHLGPTQSCVILSMVQCEQYWSKLGGYHYEYSWVIITKWWYF